MVNRSSTVSHTLAHDVDGIDAALPGVDLDFARVDRGVGATVFRSWSHPSVSFHDVTVGFSMIGEGSIGDATLVVVMPVADDHRPTKWEGRDAKLGWLNAYGPGIGHHAVDGAGWRLAVVCADIAALQNTADDLGADLPDWHGRRGSRSGANVALLESVVISGFGELDPLDDHAEVLRLLVGALAPLDGDITSRRRISSTDIVERVNSYLDTTGAWFPSIAVLCVAAAVSERRLRAAFVECFDLPPSRYLRHRALTAVHRELRHGTPTATTVSAVAMDHGFRHLGDFARYYRTTFGERPSSTLKTAQR